tara:strand:+ start:1488 stop:1721 length:234 start_codon:yes stop_codon:yes gene_type:complete
MTIVNSIFEAYRKKEKAKKHILKINDTMPITNETFATYRAQESIRKKADTVTGAIKILLELGYKIVDLEGKILVKKK